MSTFSTSCFGLLLLPSSSFKTLSTDTIKSSSFSSEHGYQITESNDLYKLSLLTLEKTFLSTSVTQVSCNASVLAFVTMSGFLLVMGEDREKTGILGMKSVYSLKSPIKVPINTRAGSVQLGVSHAAMLTSRGELYTWGTGKHGQLGFNTTEKQLPNLVQTARIFLIRQVVCGPTFTAFSTAGGFVYIYGQLPSGPCGKIKVRQPFTIRGMCDHFIEKLECNSSYLVAITDTNEAYVVDACRILKKLPISVSKLACSDSSIIAIEKDDRVIHEFTSQTEADCKANDLKETTFFIDEILLNEFEVFSGFHVSCAIYAMDEPVFEINLQMLSLRKVLIDSSEEPKDGPDPKMRKTMLRVLGILSLHVKNNKKYSVFAILLFAKCKKVALEKPLSLVLMPVFNKFLQKAFVIKRNAWKKFENFVQRSKTFYELDVLRKVQSLQGGLNRLGRKVFGWVIDCFELNEFIRNHKRHIAEKIFWVLSQKRQEIRRQGLFCIKNFTKSVKKISGALERVCELVEKSVKIKFLQSLQHAYLVKLKIYKTITQIIAYSSAQNSRVRMIKFFHRWKRNLVSVKIARISQKYARSIRTKKMAEKLIQLTRKSYKSGFTSMKNFLRPNFNRFKVIFLTNALRLALHSSAKPAFQDIRLFTSQSKTFVSSLKSLVRPTFNFILSSLKSFISRRKMIVFLKILTKNATKTSNFNHLILFRAFYTLSDYFPRPISPAYSLSTDSHKYSPPQKTSLPSRLPLVKKPSRKFLSTKSTVSLMPAERNRVRHTVILSKGMKNLTPVKRKNIRLIDKSKSIHLTQHPQIFSEAEGFESCNSSFVEISPKNQTFVENTPKKVLQWEEQILFLALAMVNSLLKSYMKGYVRMMVE